MLVALLAVIALADDPYVLPGSGHEVQIDESAGFAVDEAWRALEERRLDDAARQFAALADAGAGADARHLEALARYEAGDLRRADRATELGVGAAPEHGPLLALRGLVLADLGRGDEALALLERADRAAGSDDALKARVMLSRGLVLLDRGDPASEERFTTALALAEASGAADTLGVARSNLALARSRRGDGAPTDLLGQVSDRLRRGDTAGARGLLPSGDAPDRRSAARRALAAAAIARAEGRLDPAAAELDRALGIGREGGLVRETAAALGQLGILHGLGGQHALALERFDEAIALVAGGSLRVTELELRVEAGRSAVRAGDLDRASRELTQARAVAARGPTLPEAARIDELAGLLQASRGEVEGAAAALERAVEAHRSRGAVADAARVATEIVELLAGRDAPRAEAWTKTAAGLYASAGDPVGPAHLANALGLGLARERDLEGALAAFARAQELAAAAGTPTGARVAAIARQNAASALVVLGHSAQAEGLGLDDAVARHRAFRAAELSYEQALAAYQANRHGEARGGFDDAMTAFRALGEDAYAAAARRGRAWSAYNAAIGQPPEKAFPFWSEIVEEAVQIGDHELRVRAGAARAMTSAALGYGDPLPALRREADAAEAMGLNDVAARCWSELAERERDLVDRARAARRARTLAPDDKGAVYAVYSVAVDAYQADDYALTIALAEEILPVAGDLAGPVREVLQAARGASAD